MYKGIIFDMDGLMFDTEAAYLKANLMASDDLNIHMVAEDYYQLVGASEEEATGFIETHFTSPEQEQTFYRLTEQHVLELLEAGEIARKPGLTELLAFIEQHGLQRVIASSNNKRMIAAFLDYFKLNQYFDEIISREDVTASKPAPDLFLKAVATLNLAKSETLILEDSPNGVAAAKAAQVPVVMIPDLLQPKAAERQVATAILPDLKQVIDFLQVV
ncbi:HAD family hydrolase [Agrilactobacillus fermenti]|uniref:HAD family hydrolase n=1 Tax=Agrilactobacillus fermenti TaxID=2586909 RepID=UPI001E32D326|nr:HAD family phosphatase [Agrilactobacillus fermenti]MCD2256480.1 HAD family phosphatase [Agrilactobacillus fermenti]